MKKIFTAGKIAVAVACLASQSVIAADAGDWIFRVGATHVDPTGESDQPALNGSQSAFSGATGGASTLEADGNTQLGLTIEYMLSKNLGIELLASTPFDHTAEGKGVLNGLDVADTKHLPPTLSAVYHFDEVAGVSPYVGAGINWTIFFEEKTTTAANTTFGTLGLNNADLDLDDSVGIALQAGIDMQIDDNLSANFSVRWIDIDTDAEITFDGGNRVTSEIEIDPVVFSLMLGYKL